MKYSVFVVQGAEKLTAPCSVSVQGGCEASVSGTPLLEPVPDPPEPLEPPELPPLPLDPVSGPPSLSESLPASVAWFELELQAASKAMAKSDDTPSRMARSA
jgi:hypothetical protein